MIFVKKAIEFKLFQQMLDFIIKLQFCVSLEYFARMCSELR